MPVAELPETLPELLAYIEHNADSIYVNVQLEGGSGSSAVALSDLPARSALSHAFRWVREGRIPVMVLREPEAGAVESAPLYFEIVLMVRRGKIFFQIEPEMKSSIQLSPDDAEALAAKLLRFSMVARDYNARPDAAALSVRVQ